MQSTTLPTIVPVVDSGSWHRVEAVLKRNKARRTDECLILQLPNTLRYSYCSHSAISMARWLLQNFYAYDNYTCFLRQSAIARSHGMRAIPTNAQRSPPPSVSSSFWAFKTWVMHDINARPAELTEYNDSGIHHTGATAATTLA